MSMAVVPSVAPLASSGRHRMPVQEDLAAVRLDHDSGHGRIPIADGDDQVGDRSDRLAVLVAHGTADRLAQIEHVPPRRRVRARRRWRAAGGAYR
jgi:hypothetical protein